MGEVSKCPACLSWWEGKGGNNAGGSCERLRHIPAGREGDGESLSNELTASAPSREQQEGGGGKGRS